MANQSCAAGPTLQVVPSVEVPPEDDEGALLVEELKRAVLLPYDKMQPEVQDFWRRVARAVKAGA